jgi:hypothetical protein
MSRTRLRRGKPWPERMQSRAHKTGLCRARMQSGGRSPSNQDRAKPSGHATAAAVASSCNRTARNEVLERFRLRNPTPADYSEKMVPSTGAAWFCRSALIGVALAMASHAAADPSRKADKADKKACFNAHEQGQLAKANRKLLKAEESFAVCAAEGCPGVVREECGKWLADLQAAIPTVVPTAVDSAGHDTTECVVTVDGQPLSDRLDGRSFKVDPGEHLFRFVLADGTSIEQKHVLSEGDVRRRITADFASLPKIGPVHKAPVAPLSRPVPVATWILGGVGVVALGSFAFFAVSGKSKENDLKDHCAPNCPDADVNVMDHRYLAADISLGVGIVSLGVATYLYMARKPAISTTSAWIDLVPTTPGAGVVRYTTRF